MREPLGSSRFRFLLRTLAALTLVTAAVAAGVMWRSQRALAAGWSSVARAQEIELEVERLAQDIASADAAKESFLQTWNSGLLTAAASADARVAARFAALRPRLADREDLAGALADLDGLLSARAEASQRNASWLRAGQLNRVREWADRGAAQPNSQRIWSILDRLRGEEAVRARSLRAVLTQTVARGQRATWMTLGATLALCALVAWLLWQHRRMQRLVVLCAWTRTVQFEGEWLTFEQYLERRFGLKTSHGMRPDQYDQIVAEIAENPEDGQTPPAAP